MVIATMIGQSSTKKVIVREVWEGNLESEMTIIRTMFADFGVISIDTEFPGTIYKQVGKLDSFANYNMMKKNIDELKIIQLGLTLSDYYGNLPGFPTENRYIWQFNFRDFDIDRDPHDRSSIELLKKQGIDFAKNKAMGIDSRKFAYLFLKSGMLNNNSTLEWLTFHGAYDFGFLIKLVYGVNKLPNDLYTFSRLIDAVFGVRVYDMKSVAKHYCNFEGGLEKLAKELKIERVAGKSHQAGSDSLLTMQTYMKLQETCVTMRKTTFGEFNGLEGVLYGLEIPLINAMPPYANEEVHVSSALLPYADEGVHVSRGPRTCNQKMQKEIRAMRAICRGPRSNNNICSGNKFLVM